MSIAAQAWLETLPLECGLNLAAFRVLHKLADGHNAETGLVWRTNDRMAAELRVSKRTVQRAVRDLEMLGFIRRGDQRVISHLDVRYRPVVWELSLDLWQPTTEQVEIEGVTTGVTPEQPVDNSGSGVTAVVTPPGSRGDRHAAPGVTTVVALGTGSESSRSSTSVTTDRATKRAVQDAGHEHAFREVLDQLNEPFGEFCEDCGIRRDGKKRIDWGTRSVRPVRRSA